MDAVARNGALVIHRVEVGSRPVRHHRSLDPPAVQVVRGPVAHVRIDELRPKANDVLRYARIDLDVEIEGHAGTVRRNLGFQAAVESRTPCGELVDDKTRIERQETHSGDDGVESDRVLTRTFRTKPRVLRFQTRHPCASRSGRRLQPACCGQTRFAGKDGEVTDAKLPGGLVPVHSSRSLVDQEGERVGIVEPHFPGPDGEAADQGSRWRHPA